MSEKEVTMTGMLHSGLPLLQCFYLIDSALMGVPIPEVLPPGQFPPVDNNIGLGAMVVSSK